MHRRSFFLNTASGLGSLVAGGRYARADRSELKEAPAAGERLEFTTDFEAGSLGKVVPVTSTHTRCTLLGEVDQDGRNRQVSWYYFRVHGPPASQLTIDFTDLEGEYNYRPGNWSITPGTLPVYSYDGRHWTHVAKKDWTAVASSMRLRIRLTGSQVWIAHVPPYTTLHLERLLDSTNRQHGLGYEVIGKSVEGRDIPMLTITNPNRGRERKKVVWLMFRQHSWEAGSSWVGEGAIRFLLSSDPIATRIRNDVIFKLLPIQDPDGVFRGGVRFNAYGYDLNRNWDTVDPVRMPEITAARNAILKWLDQGGRIDFFLSLHNTETDEYLSGPPCSKFQHLGQKMLEELTRSTTFEPTHGYQEEVAPSRPGRMDVVEGLYHKCSIPAFLMEQRISYVGKLGRCPTVNDRLEFGKGLVKAIRAALA